MSEARTIRSWPGVSALDADAWDALLDTDPPFLRHGFLSSLEEAGCVGPGTGWTPTPLTVQQGDRVLGACPCYLKTHSMGEYVYDWGWADAAERAGIAYYPKLVVGVPFSPVPGRRLLVDPALPADDAATVRRQLMEGAVAMAQEVNATGVHVLFCSEQERDLGLELGMAHRLGMQLHWRNEGYEDMDAFLARFRSRRRKEIRRERRHLEASGVQIRCVSGDGISKELLDHAYRFYGATVDKFAWGRRYLNRGFFELLATRLRSSLQLVLAERDAQIVGGAISLEAHGRRHGRYWGAQEDVPFLHFEVCGYAQIEDCIQRGIQVFEAGSGAGLHKYNRGFLPALTHSVHLCFHPELMAGVDRFCRQEARAVSAQADHLTDGLFAR